MNELIKNLLGDLGNASSIISLILTILVFITIQKIKKYYIINAMVPEFILKIEEKTSSISNLRNDYDNSKEKITLELTNVCVVLENLKKIISGNPQKTIKNLITSIKKIEKNHDRDKLWDIYIELNKLLTEIEYLKEELRWER